eukprot:TRINITY_DN3211_c0_g2_i1.p1 TRINITY_DN3211_c0_g2~~TRINITY_DN3211_c0_g2_i1.p1  ORF type:complete len:585 (+),score=72.77 TRINITY_DN3211_c0_g2_i1:42-1796(+)
MLSLGQTHSLAYTDGEIIAAWGENTRGQLGNSSRIPHKEPKQAAACTLEFLCSGASHNIGISASGSVLGWGSNEFGQLGNGATTAYLSPLPVLKGIRVQTVAAGWFHSAAVTDAGQVICWGFNKQGQLGDGTTETRFSPVVAIEGGATAIACGWRHTLAVMSSGKVYSWGANDSCQLGFPSNAETNAAGIENRLLPSEVPDLSNARSVAAGYVHSLALTHQGEVFSWGTNDQSQLGDGSLENRHSPAKIIESGVCMIASGYSHCVALTKAGEVLTWGHNCYGQLGIGNTITNPGRPRKVLQQSDICGIAAGWNHTAAWTSEKGESFAWGLNDWGQVGDGTTINVLLPARIIKQFLLKVHPSNFAISYAQFEELDAKAHSHFRARYRTVRTRDMIQEVIIPSTAHLVNRGYARVLNEAELIPGEAFVSHCWDEEWMTFWPAVNEVFGEFPQPPNLWMVFTALSQSGEIRTARRPGLKPIDLPMIQALKRCSTTLLVRNVCTDVYSRLWCVWELYMFSQLGFTEDDGRFFVHGPNRGLESKQEVDVFNCATSEPEDRQWLLDWIRQESLLHSVMSVASQIRQTYFR